MSIDLTPDLERQLQAKVESGLYPTAEDVIREALQLLENRDRLRAWKFEELRKAIAIGIEQADWGEVGPLDAQATLARVRARRAQERDAG